MEKGKKGRTMGADKPWIKTSRESDQMRCTTDNNLRLGRSHQLRRGVLVEGIIRMRGEEVVLELLCQRGHQLLLDPTSEVEAEVRWRLVGGIELGNVVIGFTKGNRAALNSSKDAIEGMEGRENAREQILIIWREEVVVQIDSSAKYRKMQGIQTGTRVVSKEPTHG